MNQKLIKGGHTSHLTHHTSNRGITLVALVITIIVLLILAGVTINMVLGDEGIIGKAELASKKQEEVSQKEEEDIKNSSMNAEFISAGIKELTYTSKALTGSGEVNQLTKLGYIVEGNKVYKQNSEGNKELIATKVMIGDLNEDGVINSSDSTLLIQAYSNDGFQEEYQKIVADCNFDGWINLEDETILEQIYLAGSYTIDQNTKPKNVSEIFFESKQEYMDRLLIEIGIDNKIVEKEWQRRYNLYIKPNTVKLSTLYKARDEYILIASICDASDNWFDADKDDGTTYLKNGDTLWIAKTDNKTGLLFDNEVGKIIITE